MKKMLFAAAAVLLLITLSARPMTSLSWKKLATVWDEAVPLGNGFVGSLVWQKGDSLRMSLDRMDLWDLRPENTGAVKDFTYAWLKEMVDSGRGGEIDGLILQGRKYEDPPSKIPGAALQFPSGGEVREVTLSMGDALCRVDWENGSSMETFVHADLPYGCFVFKGFLGPVGVTLHSPDYEGSGNLSSLGYKQGKPTKRAWKENGADFTECVYRQEGWGGFFYEVAVRTVYRDGLTEGTWSVTTSLSGGNAAEIAASALKKGFNTSLREHAAWWTAYWDKSTVIVPDSLIQKQYDSEMYKFGSLARSNGAIIPLQGVWTADDGQLPPWKGDLHHDLNTQLCYWPAYAGNHLDEGYGFIGTLWSQREKNMKFTRDFYGCKGLNVPGMTDYAGNPMPSNWTQYSCSLTVSAWLAHHFYLHWKYSMDRKFLKEIGYPYLKDVATFLEDISYMDNGFRTLPTSASPEYYGNSAKAWFPVLTNFDNALMRSAFSHAAEMAGELNLPEDSVRWASLQAQMPPLHTDSKGGLEVAPGFPFDESHRHFSHAISIFPLGILDISHEKNIIETTLDNIHKQTTDQWCGYSFSWCAALEATAGHGDKAAEMLDIFAGHFVLANTFHANGDQTKQGYSKFTYRPFTLEGNMAFAGALHEMLLQSQNGYIEVFPAVPSSWNDVSFEKLRARGAFLVTASRRNGKYTVDVYSEKGGTFRFKDPLTGVITTYNTRPGQHISPKI